MKAGRRIFAVALLGVITVAALAQPTQPTTQPATLPTAQELIDRYVDATGGKAAYDSIRSRRATGTFAMADLGIEGTITLLIRRDGKALTATSLPTHGLRRRGVTDGVVWEVDFDGTARVLGGDEAKSAARTLTLDPLIRLDNYRNAKVVDVVALNGRPTFRMLLTSEAGVDEMRFYDVESSLLVKIMIRLAGPGGEPLTVVTNLGDYEDVPPIRMALKTQQMMTGMSPEVVFTKVEHDVELPDELFTPPAEVRKLLPATRPSE